MSSSLIPIRAPRDLILAPRGGLPAISDPQRDIRRGLWVAGAFFIGALGWAALARLDAAAYAPGQLIVASQRQAVQHREGGIVRDLQVRDGQRVAAGQPLILLAGEDIRADERALAARVLSLTAQRARLRAELTGAGAIDWPASLREAQGADAAIAADVMALQQRQFAARSSLLAAQRSVIGQQSRQAREQGAGFAKMVTSSNEQARLIDEELESLRTVADKGFVSVNRLRALERAKADLTGRGGQFSAGIAQAQAAATQGRMQIVEAERGQFDRAAEELRQVENALADVEPRWRAARDRVARLTLRAPVAGTVVNLKLHTVGGVVPAGLTVLDIVPENEPLIVEARVSPGDIDDLVTGMSADVRFSTLHDPAPPVLSGTVTMIAADRAVEERNGQAYYRAEVRVPRSELDRLARERPVRMALRAGTPVEVLVPLRKRTALQYALEPLRGTLWRSMREH